MRVFIIDTCYPAFLSRHYSSRPELARHSYQDQWRALMDTHFGTADAYSHYLAALGHGAHEVVANCAELQQAWARAHGVDGSAEDVMLAQARAYEPDVVYIQNLHYPSDRALTELRRLSRLVVGQIASAMPKPERLRAFDLLLSSLPHFVERFRGLGVDAAYFRIGFDERVLQRLEAERAPTATNDAVFVGSLRRTRHGRGNALLERAAKRVPVEFWGYGARGWPPWSPVRRRYRGEAWGVAMYRVLRAARISLNRHVNEAGPYANNMRLYEASGVGSLLLTDAKENLSELFRPDEEVVTYASVGELVERLLHYLQHEDERGAIAAAGQARTLREHGYHLRMKELAAILQERL